MQCNVRRGALALALVTASTATMAGTFQPIPLCDISHNHNERVCRLALNDGEPGSIDGWRIIAGEPVLDIDQDRPYVRLARPGDGVSRVIPLPLGSTVEAGKSPTYWLDLDLRSVTRFSGTRDDTSSASAHVRVSLTDERGENGVVLAEKTVAGRQGDAATMGLTVDAVPFHFNAFLRIDVVRDDGAPFAALELDDLSITHVSF